jgi:glycosyltransferase involved in cell wall biosynthesis
MVERRPASPPDPIRIARIITRLNIGGPAIQAAMLSDRLRESGFETLLIFGRLSEAEGDMSYLLDGRRVQSAFVPTLQRSVAPAADLRALVQILRHLLAFKPHVVHTHTAKAGTLGRLAAFAYNRFARTPARTVHTYHGHVLEGYFRYAGAFTRAERALAKVTDRIVAISPQIAADLQQRYAIGRPEQYVVIPLGFDLAPFAAVDDQARQVARRSLRLNASTPTVAIVGRLTAIKQHGLFLRIAREVRNHEPAAVFLIVGDGECRSDLERTAGELGISDAVRFLGWRRDLAAIYAATDVCVLTSRNEGTPVALIEALAAGVPVVSTDVGGVRDVVCAPELGQLAPDGDVGHLAAHVLDALAPAAHTAERKAVRRRSVLACYGFDRLSVDIASLYRTLLTSR